MAMEIKQSLRLSQQLVMTPQLQQAIKLLQLSRLELENVITKEMMENPVLEEEGAEQAKTEASEGEEKQEKREAEEKIVEGEDSFDWENYVESYNPTSTSPPVRQEELTSFENVITKTASLQDHLMWQLKLSDFTKEEESIGTNIIGNINDDGYLQSGLEEIASEMGADIKLCEEVLRKIQEFDPVGVGARTLQECLLLQVHNLKLKDELIEKMIREHLPDLEKKKYPIIARALGISVEKVIELTKIILELEPKPGRSFSNHEAHYIMPDVYVQQVGTDFVVVLNEEGLPKLKISNFYKSVLHGKQTSNLTKEYVQEKLRSAIWLIRSIHQRQRTIYKVTESIVKHQRDFFEKGMMFLKPMILRDVAEDIGMHESTVSRVTTNKYVHTPQGIFELKFFFSSFVGGKDLGVASESVKERIRQIVEDEDPMHPHSDQRIVEMLAAEGIEVARRTVAKYREILAILSSSRRKKFF